MSSNKVNSGLQDAARAMGCKRWHELWHVMLPETLAAIIAGMTVKVIAVVSTSAMAGVVGAGGWGSGDSL